VTTTRAQLSTCLVCGPQPGPRPAADGALRRCASCGFAWTARDPAEGAGLYDGDYNAGGGYEDHFLDAPRRFEASRRLRWLLSMTRPSSLVEAGCAGGFFVEAARRAGIDASGVEVSQVAVRFARQRLGVPVRQGCFESVVPQRPVDAVCAFHVLEQVADPREFLRAARETLRPGGWLALEVPNISSAGARRLGSAWPGLQPRYHNWHFTPESLIRLVVQSGFQVVCHDTVVFRYYLPARYRLRHAHRLLRADWAGTRSLRLTHPHLGDLLRIAARLPRAHRGIR
jgi:2-polyprenyl-3-methyl-5-hydroxy-6-metoxy-1,4-benzoquinol methylase